METESADERKNDELQHRGYYIVFTFQTEFSVVKTNCSEKQTEEVKNTFSQRLEKGILYPEVGTVLSVELTSETEEGKQNYGCFYYCINTGAEAHDDQSKCIMCLICEHEQTLEIFRTDLDDYCADLLKPLKNKDVNSAAELPLDNWYTVVIEYINRCKQALGDKLKFLIFSALHDHRLSLSGGTADLQADIHRFYKACSLSDILQQLRETKQRQDGGSLSGSLDMLVDVNAGLADNTQSTLTVSISEDSVRLDSSGCNRFCEEWASAVCRAEFQDQPAKEKQVIEAFKLKFIQTMNTLKRLLREAENDYYALHRSYVFLRDSGNSEILLHYVNTEGALDTANVLAVLQEFIQEQDACLLKVM